MSKRIVHYCLVILLIVAAACSSRARTGTGRTPDRDSILLEEIRSIPAGNAYLIIERLRPEWLIVRGQTARRVLRLVYLDDARLGDMDALRSIGRSTIGSIHFYDGPQATQKWGEGRGAGVIQIRTIR